MRIESLDNTGDAVRSVKDKCEGWTEIRIEDLPNMHQDF